MENKKKTVEQLSQKRALETRQKIIEAGFRVIAERGYHNVTVDEIAKEAGVSTGISYRYFKNKKDILMAVLEFAFDNIKQLTRTQDSSLMQFDSMKDSISYALEQFYRLHTEYYAFHEELEGMRHTDSDVKELYDRIEHEAVRELIDKCTESFSHMENVQERIVFAINILENYCHMAIDKKYEGLDKELLKKMTIESVINVFHP